MIKYKYILLNEINSNLNIYSQITIIFIIDGSLFHYIRLIALSHLRTFIKYETPNCSSQTD